MILRNKINFSLLFLLPLIASKDEHWYTYTGEFDSHVIKGEFVNGFSYDINKPWLDRHVFLIFESKADSKFNKDSLKRKENFDTNYSYRISGVFYNIYAFKIPNAYILDYNNIMEARYSLLSDNIKSRVLDFWISKEDSVVHLAMFSEEDKQIYNSPKGEIIPEEDIIIDPLELEVI